MRIGIPTEVKNHEDRVALTPAGAHHLARAGHEVLVQSGAGVGSHLADEQYERAGARVVATADEAWGGADLVCKVKEPVASEYRHLREDLVLFAYLHLAADRAGTRALLDAGTTAVAYETAQAPDGSLPLLAPMSEVAGRMATQVGAALLERPAGGRGVLLGGVPGTQAGRVVVLGGGTVGRNAARIAVGMRAEVSVVDLSLPALREVDEEFSGHVRTVASSAYAIEQELESADLVIGAVLVPGARAPRLVGDDLVARMRRGAVLVDVAVDQGGCFESSRPTTHDDPTFAVHGTTFYCVANMPGAVPVTSTHALTSATLGYLTALADGGTTAVRDVPVLRSGASTSHGVLLNRAVAAAHGLESSAVGDVLG
ncbi:alanine dehydrogenase [Cellulosimicrobium arenosum]|uniref:Alanine dehydrogenase n=1 Tax=Cellulosimicrobium arenosum TaxID=2708133 RepID=A0A927G651_9MICO|nr:alanine dehydrogenase [Cellulosimicrobium arenosum]MBD8077642.1 alanine dehydrogenase [Cellulosimicrobium arenosum]